MLRVLWPCGIQAVCCINKTMKKKAANHVRWITRVAVLAAMLATTVMATLIVSPPALAATVTSTTNGGNWNASSTWQGGVPPAAGDTVIIATTGGNAVTVGTANTCAQLTINDGAKLIIGAVAFNVTGTTAIGGGTSGNLSFSSATGIKNFIGDVRINNGAIWNEAAAPTINFSGNFMNNASTFTASTGLHRFLGTSKTINGSTNTSIPNVSINGTYTNYGTLTVGTALTGTGTLTQGTNATLKISGTCTITTLTATASDNTVNYYASATQTVKATTYNNLTLSGTSAKTTTGVTINGILSMEGTAIANAVVTYGASATLQYNTSTARTASTNEWPATFCASGGVIIANTGGINPGGNKVFNRDVPLIINSGANLSAQTRNLTFGGNFTNNGGTFYGSTGVITITNTSTNQIIDGFTTTGTVSMTKTGGTAVLDGNVNGGAFTLNGAGGTLDLGAWFSHTFTGTFTNTAGTLNLNSSTLNIDGSTATGGSGGTWNPNTSTVDYGSAGAQTVFNVSYYNLTTSGSNTKTLSAGTMTTVNNVLVVNSGTNFNTATGNITVTGTTTVSGALNITSITGTKTFNGDVIINSGSTWNETVAEDISFGGNLQNDGSFTTTQIGVHYFNGSSKTFSGTNEISIPKVTINGIYQNNGRLNVSTALAGSGTLIQGTDDTLKIGANAANLTLTNLDASTNPNTVNYYNASAQTVKNIYYSNLTLSGGGVKTTTGVTVNGILSMEGNATASVAPTYGLAATLQYNTSTNRTSSVEWITPFTATGGVIIANTGTINLSAAKVINASLAINSGAKLNLSIWPSTAGSLTLGGDNKVCGTWGSTISAADHKDNTYFALTTGILNVLCVKATPTITGVTNQAITYGTASVALSGIVSASGPIYPADEETVSVTINGESHNAVISGGLGGFSISFPTATIPCSAIPYTITYDYAGNANLNAATDTSTALTVNKADTTTTVASSVNPSTYGQPVTFTATVNITTATGTVQFYIDSETFGSPVALSGGSATSSATSSLSVGNHAVTAMYSGDSNYSTSTGTLTGGQTVTKIPVTINITAPSDISFENLQIGNNSIDGIFMVTVSPDADWYVTANSSTSGHMTTGTTNLSKEMRVQVQDQGQGEVTLSGTPTAVASGHVSFSGNISFKQEVTWNDDPGDYQIVVTFIASVP